MNAKIPLKKQKKGSSVDSSSFSFLKKIFCVVLVILRARNFLSIRDRASARNRFKNAVEMA